MERKIIIYICVSEKVYYIFIRDLYKQLATSFSEV